MQLNFNQEAAGWDPIRNNEGSLITFFQSALAMKIILYFTQSPAKCMKSFEKYFLCQERKKNYPEHNSLRVA